MHAEHNPRQGDEDSERDQAPGQKRIVRNQHHGEGHGMQGVATREAIAVERRGELLDAHLRHVGPLAHQDVLQQLLAAGGSAVSSQEIEQNLKGIDRITLYRILKAFEEVGLIHSIADGSGKTKYALCSTSCVCISKAYPE